MTPPRYAQPEYEPPKWVPLLDAHGDFTAARLTRMAKVNNARAARGEHAPLCIGHTLPGVPAKSQPTLAGFADAYKVAPFRGVPTLWGRANIRASKRALANEHPRRSIELWEPSDIIDPIALLGAETPERDLGLVQFQRGGSRRQIVRRFQATGATMDPAFKALLDQMSALIASAQTQPTPVAAVAPPGDAAVDGEPPVGAEDDELDQFAADGGAMPSGSNVTTPKLEDEPTRMQRDQYAIKLAEFERRLKASETRERETLRRMQRSANEAAIVQLEAEGYDVDRAGLLDELDGLPAAKVEAKLQRVRKFHRQRPTGNQWSGSIPLGDVDGGPSKQPTQAQVDKATAMAESGKAASYQDALGEIMGG